MHVITVYNKMNLFQMFPKLLNRSPPIHIHSFNPPGGTELVSSAGGAVSVPLARPTGPVMSSITLWTRRFNNVYTILWYHMLIINMQINSIRFNLYNSSLRKHSIHVVLPWREHSIHVYTLSSVFSLSSSIGGRRTIHNPAFQGLISFHYYSLY